MDIVAGLSIGRTFLTQMDAFLAANWQHLTCDDIYRVYDQFFNDLKDFKGNAYGFTGLSEYLVFRFLYHQLGGSFRRERITRDLSDFVGKSNAWRIGQSIPVRVGDRHRRCLPDIVLYQEDRLMMAIQVKLYLTAGVSEVRREAATFAELRALNPGDFRALLLIYSHSLSGRGSVRQELAGHKNASDWFDFVVLKGNHERLADRLDTSLLLSRLQPPLHKHT